jgi:prepilin-type N-terminal cleavage/methylation domain-containing protein
MTAARHGVLSTPRTWRGFTLLEVVVTITVLAIVYAVASVSLRDSGARSALRSGVAAARRTALASGLAIRVEDSLPEGRVVRSVVHPDGMVVTDAKTGVERLTGVAAVAPAIRSTSPRTGTNAH